MKKRYIIIGASASGCAAISTLVRLDKNCEIICFSKENQLPYNTCLLAQYLCNNKTKKELLLFDENYFKENNITLLLNTVVSKINHQKKIIITQNGDKFSYDKLLLTTGAIPKKTDKFNSEHNGLFYASTLTDIDNIKKFIEDKFVKKVIIVGAGINGLEFTNAFNLLGFNVTIIEKNNRVLNNILDKLSSSWLAEKLCNINIICNAVINDYHFHNGVINKIKINEEWIDIELVIFTIGSDPNFNLAANSLINCNKGIIVDNFMKTNIDDIYASGDCVQVLNKSTQKFEPTFSWSESTIQGIVAARRMCSVPAQYEGFLPYVVCKLDKIQIIYCGKIDYNLQVARKIDTDNYSIFFIEDNKLVGFILIGDASQAGMLKTNVLQKKFLRCKVYFNAAKNV